MNKILIERDREGWYGIGPGPCRLYNHESGVFLLPHHIIFTVPATKYFIATLRDRVTHDNLCDAREPEKQCI